MIVTDGNPTIAWAGARGRDIDSRRRYLDRKRAAKRAAVYRALARKFPGRFPSEEYPGEWTSEEDE